GAAADLCRRFVAGTRRVVAELAGNGILATRAGAHCGSGGFAGGGGLAGHAGGGQRVVAGGIDPDGGGLAEGAALVIAGTAHLRGDLGVFGFRGSVLGADERGGQSACGGDAVFARSVGRG